ncbi:hypothetical protein RhiirA5_408941 [Rhizophagus irregularis]|jgi:hypothetical protein|uniref:HMG box domain-containing protein n=4 Tax=Rhizophagus irregularis TaxID=588596 RepID=U9U1U8_RHIID|nr:hypothetical protein GLOIN_2v1572982 [Rhizophagus irregularis DAOM 181602=DAOM 197198]ANQ32962.1 MATA-HMG [Rhizophagus irregularis]EXX53638.1 hypothetical protein RirG_242120 [Rhizophagus irregularis DAOM 197198w]ANQ32964.1 MATA-HMG [Rhizophagus irregularis]ANQ32965.1 MATA-HMG [Rhizophagus irregularis]ANQ32966.1 MATA-HMG [Rhizophagus irregularis]|eukprot:XP_025181635.1 hypothetical protein GLOIN_2v1572982 [Rhizophagus irregularis DAOM 181602=DAOM 197198]
MPRSAKPKSSLYSPYDKEENNNRNFEIPFIFQDYNHSSSSKVKNTFEESFDTLINRLTTNPPYKLTLTVDELLAPSKKNLGSRSRPKSIPPRPQNVFILFKKDLTARLKLEPSNKDLSISRISSLAKVIWANLSNEARQFFEILYLACIEKHKSLYPGYRYTPKKKPQPEENKSRSKNLSSNIKKQVTVFPKLDYDDLFTELFHEDSAMNEFFDFHLWDSHQK